MPPNARRRGEPPVRHRESALVRHALAAAGVELSEPMACGLGGGIGFLYAVFTYSQVPHPLLTIVAQHHPQPWAPAVFDRLGVAYHEQHSTATPSALAKLRRALDTGPVLCTVDRSRLPWHGPGPLFASADPYVVLVMPASGDDVSVLDDGRSPVTLPAEVFARAWAGHTKGRHHLLQITSAPSSVDLRSAVRSAVATTVAHLTGPVLGKSLRASGRSWAALSRPAMSSVDTDRPREVLDEIATLVEASLTHERAAIACLSP